ncbi:hypothetical protein [Hoeflea poritis]|uniref:Phasin domain-containing protein n=1 Tax=Hoeflea poritis TaxID=2993659 RepID=A0ABT4VPA4_9HYPH|nr:hypothetical protein [Hoeflea poritis]MDA4845902.1 hypothetical protein [Hoeflea poritis]
MFKKLFQAIFSADPVKDMHRSVQAKDTAVLDGGLTREDFLHRMEAFQAECQSVFNLVGRAKEHAATVAETGRVEQAFIDEAESALEDVQAAEIEIANLNESAAHLSQTLLGRLDKTADMIADAHSALESALNDIRMAKIDFNSNRDDDDDDDFDGD